MADDPKAGVFDVGAHLPRDITDDLADMKPENRVFRGVAGGVVKIKTWRTPSLQPGIEQYLMTGALADDDGKALTAEDGSPMIVGERGFALTYLDPRDTRSKEAMIRTEQLRYAQVLERVQRASQEALPSGVAEAQAGAVEIRAGIALLRAPAASPVAERVLATRGHGHPMPIFEDGETARAALRGFDRDPAFDALPDDLKTGLLATATAFSAVDAIVQTAELIYARRGEVTGSLLALGAGLAAMGATLGWQGLAVEGRGAKIAAALRREAGEPHPIDGRVWPGPDTDPEPLKQFVPAAHAG